MSELLQKRPFRTAFSTSFVPGLRASLQGWSPALAIWNLSEIIEFNRRRARSVGYGVNWPDIGGHLRASIDRNRFRADLVLRRRHRVGRAMRGQAPAGQIAAELSRRGSSEGRSQGRLAMRHARRQGRVREEERGQSGKAQERGEGGRPYHHRSSTPQAIEASRVAAFGRLCGDV